MDLGLSEIDMGGTNDSCNHLGLFNDLRHILPHPFPLPRNSIVDTAIVNFVICVIFEIVSHGMCSNVDVSLFSDIRLAVVNFALSALSTQELFACFCTHHVLERSMGHGLDRPFHGVTYTCRFQSSSCRLDSWHPHVQTAESLPHKDLNASTFRQTVICIRYPIITGCCGDRPWRDPYKCVLKAWSPIAAPFQNPAEFAERY